MVFFQFYKGDYTHESKFLGKSQGANDDFIKGMLKFEKFNSYVGLVRREIGIAFDHEGVLKEYFDYHSSQADSWLYSFLADIKEWKELTEAIEKEAIQHKKEKEAAKRARHLKKKSKN